MMIYQDVITGRTPGKICPDKMMRIIGKHKSQGDKWNDQENPEVSFYPETVPQIVGQNKLQKKQGYPHIAEILKLRPSYFIWYGRSRGFEG